MPLGLASGTSGDQVDQANHDLCKELRRGAVGKRPCLLIRSRQALISLPCDEFIIVVGYSTVSASDAWSYCLCLYRHAIVISRTVPTYLPGTAQWPPRKETVAESDRYLAAPLLGCGGSLESMLTHTSHMCQFLQTRAKSGSSMTRQVTIDRLKPLNSSLAHWWPIARALKRFDAAKSRLVEGSNGSCR